MLVSRVTSAVTEDGGFDFLFVKPDAVLRVHGMVIAAN